MARVRPSLLAISGLLALGTAPVFAGPNGPSVVGGSATISGAGTASVTVTQSSPSAIINWNTFNIGAGEITRFNQPNASSVVLNRVTGGQGASEIYGTISANGRVFLINRDGILFGPGSKVDTAGFLATTHDINNDDFMAGRYVFGIPGRPDASIVNQGTITAHSYGFAALVAPGVRNTGTITANLGTVALVSGTGFTLDFYGDRLITLSVGDQIAAQVRDVATGLPLSSLVTNTGKLKANGGRVELTAATARQVVDSVINNTGVIEANTFRRHGGTIVLSAGTGSTKVAGAPKQTIKLSGTLSASAKKKGKGGKIIVTAENIEVSGATINATGPAGGGTVLIGGDWSGGNPNTSLVSNGSAHLEPYAVPTAATVTVDGASTINASATGNGNGGKVIVWADQLNTFAGTILARGGPNGGDGGFVETSGHQQLVFSGNVDTRAPNGANGTLLLDPADTYIDASFITRPPGSTEILTATLISQLNNGNVVISTNNSTSPVGQNGDIFVTGQVSWSNSSSLTLNAFRNIEVSAVGSVATIINTGGGNLVLRADSTGTGTGRVILDQQTFNNRIDWSGSTGTVTLFYNPPSGYASPSNYLTGSGTGPVNFGGFVTVSSSSQLTAYMLVNSDINLQNVTTNLHGTYALGRDITSFTNVPNFAPIGAVSFGFTGVFEGLGHTISNINIAPTLATTNNIGMFANIGAAGVVRNFNITNATVTANANVPPPGQFVGILAGQNSGTVTNMAVSGLVNGMNLAGVIVGGLVGQNQASGLITQSLSSATVSVGNATSANGNDAGGLVGNNEGAVTQSSASGNITGGASTFLGGLVGRNDNFSSGAAASIANSSASGNVTAAGGTVFSSSAGGLVGFNSSKGTVTNSSASGNVTAGAFALVGGLVGQNEGLITQSSFSGGTVSGAGSFAQPDSIGGLVGANHGTVQDSNATAIVTGAFVNAGGLVGFNQGTIAGTTPGLTFANATVTISGDGSRGGGLVGTNDTGAIIRNVSATGSVAPSAVALPTDFLIFGGLVAQNRGSIDASTAAVTVTMTGQFGSVGGLVGENDGTITNSSASGAVSGTASSVSQDALLGGLVGNNTAGASIANSFATGVVSAVGNSLVGGLIGTNDGAVTDSHASGAVTVTTANSNMNLGGSAGGLIGFNNNGAITNSYATGAVTVTLSTGSNAFPGENAGGLIGSNFGSSITNVYATGSVTLTNSNSNPNTFWTSAAGGLIGLNEATVTNSYATGAVIVTNTGSGTMGGPFAFAGGLIGQNFGPAITNSYATGNVTVAGPNLAAGGLVGENFLGTIRNSQAFGSVSAGATGQGNVLFSDQNGAHAGGLVGYNTGTIVGTTAVSLGSSCTVGASFSCATGAVIVGSGNIGGGLVGSNFGTITQAFATGNVGTVGVAYLEVGGLVGENLGTIQHSFATGNVRAGDLSLAGGLVGGNYTDNGAGLIVFSAASGNVTVGTESLAGGFAGVNAGTIRNSTASGAVTGGSSTLGGLVGSDETSQTGFDGAISNSSASGAVTSTGPNSIVGGLVGWGTGTIVSSSSSGPVTGTSDSYLGGLVGINTSLIQDSFTAPTSTVTGTGSGNFAGGLVGLNLGSIDPSHSAGNVASGPGSIVGGFVGANAAIQIPNGRALAFLTTNISPLIGTISADSAGTGSASGGPGSTVGSQVGQNYPVAGLPDPDLPYLRLTSPNPPFLSCNGSLLCGGTLFNPFPQAPTPTPTPSPLPLPLAEVTLPAGTPIYPIQQIADYWRDATPAAVPAALVTPPAPLQAVSRRQSVPNTAPQNAPRESGVPPPGETRFIQDQVVFRICGVPESRVQTIARGIGLVSIGSQRLGLVGCTIYQYRITDGQSVRHKIRRLERLRIVASAQPNYVFALAQVPPAPAPTPPASEGDPAQYLVAKLRLPEVHRLARGNNVRVAVIDSEIDVNHPDLEGVIAERFDATGAAEKPHPHGTGMAGAIASHKRLIGIAPGVRMLAVHAFGAATTGGQGTTMQIVKGLDWAVKQNARIVNMSFAGPKDPLLTQAVKATHDKGIVLIAAAGNAGPDSPPLYPGADPNVIAVTATDEDDHSYTSANRGKYVAVAAPGVDVLVPAPDGSYQLTTGTSVAAAEVSGVAALLLEKDPKLTPDEIRSILTSTAKTLGAEKRDDEFGYGLVDPLKALTSVNPKAASLVPAPVPRTIAAQ